MNSVGEEDQFDLDYINEILHYLPTNSRKRQQYHDRREFQHHQKIQASFNQVQGIYKANVVPAQEDNGANRTCTSNKNLLINFKSIAPYPINGVNSDGPALHCTGIGYLPWKNEVGEVLLIECLYSPSIQGTIISPNAVVSQFKTKFSGYEICNDFDTRAGECKFIARDGYSHITFTTYMENNLWFHYLAPITTHDRHKLSTSVKSIVNSLSDGANYELWHHRLGHPGQKVMERIHKVAI